MRIWRYYIHKKAVDTAQADYFTMHKFNLTREQLQDIKRVKFTHTNLQTTCRKKENKRE